MDEIDLHNLLRQEWEKTPLTKKVSGEDFRILSQENRYLILRALNDGIKESENDFQYKRHMLTAQEILDYIQKNHNEDFKLTNVYFHLQKLQEKGMIKEVDQKGETGKRPKTFYGRTAKIFLNVNDMGEDLEDEFYTKLFTIIKKIRPDLDENEIKKPFQRLNEMKWGNELKILDEWFACNKEIIDRVDIDNTKLYMYLARLLDFHNEFMDYNDKIADLLQLNLNIS